MFSRCSISHGAIGAVTSALKLVVSSFHWPQAIECNVGGHLGSVATRMLLRDFQASACTDKR